jgi:hypothetical protein
MAGNDDGYEARIITYTNPTQTWTMAPRPEHGSTIHRKIDHERLFYHRDYGWMKEEDWAKENPPEVNAAGEVSL